MYMFALNDDFEENSITTSRNSSNCLRA